MSNEKRRYINFSKLWPKLEEIGLKLSNKVFTTIRPVSYSEHCDLDEIVDIKVRDKVIFQARVMKIRELKLDEITDRVASIDADMSAEKLKKILTRIYKKDDVPAPEDYVLITLRKVFKVTSDEGEIKWV